MPRSAGGHQISHAIKATRGPLLSSLSRLGWRYGLSSRPGAGSRTLGSRRSRGGVGAGAPLWSRRKCRGASGLRGGAACWRRRRDAATRPRQSSRPHLGAQSHPAPRSEGLALDANKTLSRAPWNEYGSLSAATASSAPASGPALRNNGGVGARRSSPDNASRSATSRPPRSHPS